MPSANSKDSSLHTHCVLTVLMYDYCPLTHTQTHTQACKHFYTHIQHVSFIYHSGFKQCEDGHNLCEDLSGCVPLSI